MHYACTDQQQETKKFRRKDKIIIEIVEDEKEIEFEQKNESDRIVKTEKEKQNAVDVMQDEIHDQRAVDFSQNRCKRGIERKEAARNKIEKMNNKMKQSTEEKDDIIMESLEEKKGIVLAHPRESNRIEKQ